MIIVPQEQFNKCVTSIELDRTLNVKVNFHLPLESIKRTNGNLRPKKRCKLSNAAAPLSGFVVKKVVLFCIKYSLEQSTGDDVRLCQIQPGPL